MGRLAPLLLLLVACGRVGFDPMAVGDAQADALSGRGSRGGASVEDGGVFDIDAFVPVPNASDDAAAGGAGGTPGPGGSGGAATGGTPGMGGMIMDGGAPGSGGVVASGGAMGAGGMPSSGPSAAIASYYGSWVGTSRNGGLTYPVELAIVDRTANEKIGLFHIPTFDCGGIMTLRTLGESLVYSETLLFDPRSNCGPAGTTTLTPTGSGTLGYAFFDGKRTDRGSVARRAGYIGPTPVPWLNVSSLWSGATTNTNPGGSQSVNLALFPTQVGNIGGHVLYPTKNCAATLTLTGVNGQTLTYVEKLSHAIASCQDGNTVTITGSVSTLVYKWSGSSGASGTGTLSAFK